LGTGNIPFPAKTPEREHKMANPKLDWTNFTVSDQAPEEVRQALVDLEAAREMEQGAKHTLGLYVATRITVPSGHTVKIGTNYGKLSYALAKGNDPKKAVAF